MATISDVAAAIRRAATLGDPDEAIASAKRPWGGNLYYHPETRLYLVKPAKGRLKAYTTFDAAWLESDLTGAKPSLQLLTSSGKSTPKRDSDLVKAAEPSPKTEIAVPPTNPMERIICPHCQVRGKVRTKRVTVKAGVSGAKATGALLTAGLSLFFAGLSRKEQVTEARCYNCGSTWHF